MKDREPPILSKDFRPPIIEEDEGEATPGYVDQDR
jgi:hypothetical protein